jgi:hypothetical protein
MASILAPPESLLLLFDDESQPTPEQMKVASNVTTRSLLNGMVRSQQSRRDLHGDDPTSTTFNQVISRSARRAVVVKKIDSIRCVKV